MEQAAWKIGSTVGPIVMSALHAGHDMRAEVASLCALSPMERMREEDPYTQGWIGYGDHRIEVSRSRFEVDFNRPPDGCVYCTPAEAWGMGVWKDGLPEEVVLRSRELHRQFYQEVQRLLDGLLTVYPRVVVLDIHSYNHRRQGPTGPAAPLAGNPDIDLLIPEGERQAWRACYEVVYRALSEIRVDGRLLTVGNNVRFQRAAFGDWVARTYGRRVFVLVIEFKKIFMDEWSGRLDQATATCLGGGLARAVAELRPLFGQKNGGSSVAGRSPVDCLL
ncbi:MAG: N-formylglutamate amidohydrolase [Magnetococcales bacterium]|nr:N-formylglutamate amidohydrolase [Magnetococcales bacterium]NGZ26255.1 N-formylglutamate amidohydrolase [Magnetococcales bacterium]